MAECSKMQHKNQFKLGLECMTCKQQSQSQNYQKPLEFYLQIEIRVLPHLKGVVKIYVNWQNLQML